MKNPYKSNAITVLTKAQATQHGFNVPSRSYRKLRSMPAYTSVSIKEYVSGLGCRGMLFRFLGGIVWLRSRRKLDYLVRQC